MRYLPLVSAMLGLLVVAVANDGSPGDELASGAYSLTRTPAPRLLVRGVDLKALAGRRLADFRWQEERTMGRFGRRARLVDMNTNAVMELTVAVYTSVDEAQAHALSWLNGMASIHRRLSRSEAPFADAGNCWVSERGASSAVVFLRVNVLVDLSLYKPDALDKVVSLASALGSEGLSGGDGVDVGDRAPGLQIAHVSMPTFVRQGEEAQVEIGVVGGDSENVCVGIVCPGVTVAPGPTPGEFRLRGVSPGRHAFLVVAVGQTCVVSSWQAELAVY